MHRLLRQHSGRRGRRPSLTVSAAAVLLAAAPLLTACGGAAHPGAAAVVGGQRITVAQLEGRVDEIRNAQRSAAPDDQQYAQAIAKSGGLTRTTLQTLVLDRVLHRAAGDAGVTTTPKELQEFRAGYERQAGGAKALEATWLQQYNVAPGRLDESLRSELEARKLAQRLGADMNTTAGSAVFWKALAQASKKLHVDLNPRYGAWDDEKSRPKDAKTPWLRDVSAPQQA
ncbi:SurA N-terminal domain-containing protein [Streptomyces sp. NPDC002004]